MAKRSKNIWLENKLEGIYQKGSPSCKIAKTGSDAEKETMEKSGA